LRGDSVGAAAAASRVCCSYRACGVTDNILIEV